QVLIQIKPDDFENILEQKESDRIALEAQKKGAESNYDRTLRLVKRGAATQEHLDDVEAQFHALEAKLKAAEAEVNQAKLNLEYTKITAPADGKIGRKSFEAGMLANVGQPLLGFVAGNERWVVANLKETDMELVSPGKSATIEVDAIPGREFKGT